MATDPINYPNIDPDGDTNPHRESLRDNLHAVADDLTNPMLEVEEVNITREKLLTDMGRFIRGRKVTLSITYEVPE